MKEISENQGEIKLGNIIIADNLSLVIPQGKYTGYLWESDSVTCKIFKKQDIGDSLPISSADNPYVVEGFLCDDEWSYSIKFLDGKYYCCRFNFKDLQGIIYERHSYIPSFKGVRKVCFNEYWRKCSDKDKRCNGFETLVPSEFVFIGFDVEV